MSDKKLGIIASKGTLDWAYPPFILASTAAALGLRSAGIFHVLRTALLKKNLDLKVSPLGNPGMPMKMPFGPQVVQGHQLEHPERACRPWCQVSSRSPPCS